MSKVLVIGGGPAGMYAAIAASANGHDVTILEKNEKFGKKLFITGKGRCNLTNAGDMETVFASVMSNRKFLYSAFYACTNEQVMDFFEANGLRLKVERGNRVFPASDHSSDVIATLKRVLERQNVTVRLRTEVARLNFEYDTETAGNHPKSDTRETTESVSEGRVTTKETNGRVSEGRVTTKETNGRVSEGRVTTKEMNERASERRTTTGKTNDEDGIPRISSVTLTNGEKLSADAVIIACGGLSYPSTGSTGDGLRFAEAAGHTTLDVTPSLVPMEVKEDWVHELQGLSLKNVSIRLSRGKKMLYEDFGEMLFTHFGVSGPVILSASASIRPKEWENHLTLVLDLKPALSEEQLDKRILRDFEAESNRQYKNALNGLFPSKLVPVMVSLSGIDPEKKVNEVTREERRHLVELTKHLPMTVMGLRGFDEAIITKGGVNVKEVDPSTMESRLCKNLYFCGEVLDVDALTGGYNLQIAWSTGYLAGSNIR